MCNIASTIPITVSVEGLAHHATWLYDQQAGSLCLELRNDDLLWRFESGWFSQPSSNQGVTPLLGAIVHEMGGVWQAHITKPTRYLCFKA